MVFSRLRFDFQDGGNSGKNGFNWIVKASDRKFSNKIYIVQQQTHFEIPVQNIIVLVLLFAFPCQSYEAFYIQFPVQFFNAAAKQRLININCKKYHFIWKYIWHFDFQFEYRKGRAGCKWQYTDRATPPVCWIDMVESKICNISAGLPAELIGWTPPGDTWKLFY